MEDRSCGIFLRYFVRFSHKCTIRKSIHIRITPTKELEEFYEPPPTMDFRHSIQCHGVNTPGPRTALFFGEAKDQVLSKLELFNLLTI